MKIKGLFGIMCISPLLVTPLVSCNNDKPEIKVILMAGQSNMEGHDAYYDKDYTDPSGKTFYALDEYICEEYKNGHNNVKIDYDCTYNRTLPDPQPINTSNGEFVKVDFGYGRSSDYFGPEVGFAKYLGQYDPTQTYYIIKSAQGSSGLYDKWSKTGECFQTFVQDVNIGLNNIRKLNKSFKICGFIWMQGEQDAQNPEQAPKYKENMIDLINRINDNFSQYYSDDGLTIVDGGISIVGSSPDYAIVNKAKKELANTYPRYEYVSLSERLPMINQWHYTNASYLALGEAFASAYLNAK